MKLSPIDIISDDVAKFIAENKGSSNKDKSLLQVYHFMKSPPQQVFAYPIFGTCFIGTFMGDKLGKILHKGKLIKDNFGGFRSYIRVLGYNNIVYWGYEYETYCRLYSYKNKSKNKKSNLLTEVDKNII